MKEFNEWFNEKLTVGAFPFTQNKHFDSENYDYVINVSDEFYRDINIKLYSKNCMPFWFPMSECGTNGINSIYGACYILRIAEQRKLRVYLHCHAGIHRSRVVQDAYYYMRTKQEFYYFKDGNVNPLRNDCNRGYLPEWDKMKEIISNMNTEFEELINRTDYKMGGILDLCKLNIKKI